MKIFNLNEIRIHSFTGNELERSLLTALSGTNDPQIIITLNLDFLRITEINKEFLHICKNSLWNLPDGSGITNLLKLKYSQKINRITGNDVFPLLLRIAEQNNYRVALVGSSVKVLSDVQNLIGNKYPGITNNLICISPINNFENDVKLNEKVVNDIISFQPDIVFAALGCPRQELWLWKNMKQFKSKINIGIGAVFDYYSGKKRRSPQIFQRLSLEWFWRLINEPGRLFKRYIINDIPFFIKKLIEIKFNR
jgi:N-acetylglucosaminyldiphosphoundecaprenol N-acetyl-beta-D-mannosaminyltransferase